MSLRTFQDWGGAGRGLTEVEWDGRSWILEADADSVFTPGGKNEDGIFYLLVTNDWLQYVGMTLFYLAASEEKEGYDPGVYYSPIGEVFFQYEWEIEEMIGPKGLDYAEMTIAKRLASYLDETSF